MEGRGQALIKNHASGSARIIEHFYSAPYYHILQSQKDSYINIVRSRFIYTTEMLIGGIK